MSNQIKIDPSEIFKPSVIRIPDSVSELVLSDGIGKVGDIVLVEPLDESLDIIDAQGQKYKCVPGTAMFCALGNRESSTHASGGVLADGIPLKDGSELHWLGGTSGIVGLSNWTPSRTNTHQGQFAVRMRCRGLIIDASGNKVTVGSLVKTAKSTVFALPTLVVGGSAADVGKTTLAAKFISALVSLGVKVVAVKATGSGGIVDSLSHRKAGAQYVVDLVDAGFVSTYIPDDEFGARYRSILLLAQDTGADFAIVELGGDINWANNSVLLKDRELLSSTKFAAVISSDAFSMFGTHMYLSKTNPQLEKKVCYFSSPFRNHLSFSQRTASLLEARRRIYDPNSFAHIHELAERLTN